MGWRECKRTDSKREWVDSEGHVAIFDPEVCTAEHFTKETGIDLIGGQSMGQLNMDMVNRAEVSRLLAQAIAYKNCGKDDKAEAAARELVHLLVAHGILRDPLEV